MSNCSDYVFRDDVRNSNATDAWDGSGDDGDPPNTNPSGDPTLEEVLRVVFDVGVGERVTYLALAERGSASAGDLAKKLNRNRSNVSRYLKSLYQKGLVTRRRRILQSGGHVYEYSVRSPEQVRQLLHAELSKWTRTADKRVNELVTEIAENNSQVSS
jgi:predicted transcriptional regulator